tara:strand:+ start:248 stop:1513 length:1266 start_codon:yes stop_codon:yes gene_type:complete
MVNNFIKNFLVILFYVIFCTYSLEFLTYLFLKKEKNFAERGFDQIKREIFTKNNNFDQRGDYQAFYEESTKNNLQPSFKLSQNNIIINDHQNKISSFLINKIESGRKIPFRGPINSPSLGSNEAGIREIIYNDHLGFKNFNSDYEKKIDIIIVGDSFAEGLPFSNEHTVSGFINKKKNFNSLNFGFHGAGPLGALGVIREYVSIFKPKSTYYLYYEGNDLLDLSYEKKTFLVKYLEENYSQNLYTSKEEIETFLNEYNKLFFEILPFKINQEKNNSQKITLEENKIFVEKLKDFIELQSLKEMILDYIFSVNNEKNDYVLFEEIINVMKKDISKWDGDFTVIYLPSFNRYNKNFSLGDILKKRKVSKITENNNIQLIDMDDIFRENNMDNNNLFNLGLYGHYIKEGYELIANTIIKDINVN